MPGRVVSVPFVRRLFCHFSTSRVFLDLGPRPVGGETGLGVEEDCEDGPTVIRREARELGALVATGEDLPQAAIEVVLGWRGERIERLRVDQVAARMGEQPAAEVEVAE